MILRGHTDRAWTIALTADAAGGCDAVWCRLCAAFLTPTQIGDACSARMRDRAVECAARVCGAGLLDGTDDDLASSPKLLTHIVYRAPAVGKGLWRVLCDAVIMNGDDEDRARLQDVATSASPELSTRYVSHLCRAMIRGGVTTGVHELAIAGCTASDRSVVVLAMCGRFLAAGQMEDATRVLKRASEMGPALELHVVLSVCAELLRLGCATSAAAAVRSVTRLHRTREVDTLSVTIGKALVREGAFQGALLVAGDIVQPAPADELYGWLMAKTLDADVHIAVAAARGVVEHRQRMCACRAVVRRLIVLEMADTAVQVAEDMLQGTCKGEGGSDGVWRDVALAILRAGQGGRAREISSRIAGSKCAAHVRKMIDRAAVGG